MTPALEHQYGSFSFSQLLPLRSLPPSLLPSTPSIPLQLLSSALHILAIGSNDYAFTFSNSTTSPVASVLGEGLISQWGVLNSPEAARKFRAMEKRFRKRILQRQPNTQLTFHFVPKALAQALKNVVGNISSAAEV